MKQPTPLFADMLQLPRQPGYCLPPFDPRLVEYSGSLMGALLLQKLYYEQLEDIREWVHRNTARYEAGSELTPFPTPRQYTARDLQARLFVGTSRSTINRLLLDLEGRRLITFLPGETKHDRRISLSAEVGATLNAETERRHQASQTPRAKV